MQKVIGQYTIKEKTGESRGRKFYRAISNKDNLPYNATEISSRSFKADISIQIDLLKSIKKTPYVITFIEIIRTPASIYLFYQYYNGEDLAEILNKQSKFQQSKAIKIFQQLQEAFRIISDQKSILPEIKPQNIYFHDGNVKVGGFKFCKNLDSQKGSQYLYKPPEFYQNRMINEQHDLVWTLGIIFYEMLFGLCPFSLNQINKLMNFSDSSHLNFPENIKISDQITKLLQNMLKKDISQRISWRQIEQLIQQYKLNHHVQQKDQEVSQVLVLQHGVGQQIQQREAKTEELINNQQQKGRLNIQQQKQQFILQNAMQNLQQPIQADLTSENKQNQMQDNDINLKVKVRQKVKIQDMENQIKVKQKRPTVFVSNGCANTKKRKKQWPAVNINIQKQDIFISTHYGYFCDICQQSPILGIRYHCNLCKNFDICKECYTKNGHEHKLSQNQQSEIYQHICKTLAKLQKIGQVRRKVIDNKPLFENFKQVEQQQKLSKNSTTIV